MPAKKTKRVKKNAIETKNPIKPMICSELGWLRQDERYLKVYRSILEMYRNVLRRNASEEIRQWSLCSALLACWKGEKQPSAGQYAEEYSDFLLNVFRQSLQSGNLNQEESAVVCEAIRGRQSSGVCAERLGMIDRVFKDGRKLNKKYIHELERNGFSVREGGCNIHIYYGGHLFSCGCTPSENRSGKNLAGIIKYIIDIERVYMK